MNFALSARLFAVLLCLCWVLTAADPVRAAEPPVRAQTVAETPLGVGALVLGILGYTGWPGEPRPLNLCLSRGSADAVAIQLQFEQARPGRNWTLRSIEPDAPLPDSCDAVYLDGWQAAPLRQALRTLATRPVLSIGRGPEFCSDGGLFCLENSPTGLRFEANLDAIGRSGLRVNPLVLRLVRPRPMVNS